MTKQTSYAVPTLDLVVLRQRADAVATAALKRRTYNTVKIKKRFILGKILQEKSAFG